MKKWKKKERSQNGRRIEQNASGKCWSCGGAVGGGSFWCQDCRWCPKMWGALLSFLHVRDGRLSGEPTWYLVGFIFGVRLAEIRLRTDANVADAFGKEITEYQEQERKVWERLEMAEVADYHEGFLRGLRAVRNGELNQGPRRLYLLLIQNRAAVNEELRRGGVPALREWVAGKLPRNYVSDEKFFYTLIRKMDMPNSRPVVE